METRKITVVSTKTQKKSVIMSAATTLRELKADFRENNIDYTDMTFYEGLSRTELKDDNSLLPHDVPYKGNITNELVFMLTNTNKKIKSGATMDRKELYGKIKEFSLENACKERYGKNYTQCKTEELAKLVESTSNTRKTKNDEVAVENIALVENNPKEYVDEKARKVLQNLIESLYYNDTINEDEKDAILEPFNNSLNYEKTNSLNKSSYSKDEIDDMFNFIH